MQECIIKYNFLQNPSNLLYTAKLLPTREDKKKRKTRSKVTRRKAKDMKEIFQEERRRVTSCLWAAPGEVSRGQDPLVNLSLHSSGLWHRHAGNALACAPVCEGSESDWDSARWPGKAESPWRPGTMRESWGRGVQDEEEMAGWGDGREKKKEGAREERSVQSSAALVLRVFFLFLPTLRINPTKVSS